MQGFGFNRQTLAFYLILQKHNQEAMIKVGVFLDQVSFLFPFSNLHFAKKINPTKFQLDQVNLTVPGTSSK